MYWLNIFSYWIYILFILFYFKVNTFNPYPLFILLLFRDIITIFFINNHQEQSTTLVTFLRIFLFISFHYLPLYYLYKLEKKHKYKNHTYLYALVFYSSIFLIYITYLHSINLNFNEVYYSNLNNKAYNNIQNFIKDRFNNYFECIVWILLTFYINYKILITKIK